MTHGTGQHTGIIFKIRLNPQIKQRGQIRRADQAVQLGGGDFIKCRHVHFLLTPHGAGDYGIGSET